MGFCEVEYEKQETLVNEMKWKTWKLLKYPSRVALALKFSAHNRVLLSNEDQQTTTTGNSVHKLHRHDVKTANRKSTHLQRTQNLVEGVNREDGVFLEG